MKLIKMHTNAKDLKTYGSQGYLKIFKKSEI